jgi:ribosomal protein S18 acetylase RimI-like enzyme
MRFATDEDISFVVEWLKDESLAPFLQVEMEKEIKDLAHMVCDYGKKECALILEDHQVPMGIAALQMLPFKKIHHHCLLFLLIDPKQREKGFGKKLLNEIEQIGKKQLHLEFIECELYENPSIGWFEKQGYRQTIRQENFLHVKGQERARSVLRKSLDV